MPQVDVDGRPFRSDKGLAGSAVCYQGTRAHCSSDCVSSSANTSQGAVAGPERAPITPPTAGAGGAESGRGPGSGSSAAIFLVKGAHRCRGSAVRFKQLQAPVVRNTRAFTWCLDLLPLIFSCSNIGFTYN